MMVESRPVWGAWIEMSIPINLSLFSVKSRPVWGAWIEIELTAWAFANGCVAPRMGRVD